MIVLFKCRCFHAAFTFTLPSNSYTEKLMHDAEKLSCSSFCTIVTFSLTLIPSPTSQSVVKINKYIKKIKSSKIPCVARSSPLHFHALLSPSFPLSPYHFASHLWQDTGEQLPGPDLYLSNALPRLATSFPPFFASPLWLSLSPPISALVCALRLCVHIRTETHPDSYLSALCRIHNVRRPVNDIHSLCMSLSFFPSMSLWCKCKCAYIFLVISVSCPYGEENVNPTLSVQNRGALWSRDR